jgi:hypothetical protein
MHGKEIDLSVRDRTVTIALARETKFGTSGCHDKGERFEQRFGSPGLRPVSRPIPIALAHRAPLLVGISAKNRGSRPMRVTVGRPTF